MYGFGQFQRNRHVHVVTQSLYEYVHIYMELAYMGFANVKEIGKLDLANLKKHMLCHNL